MSKQVSHVFIRKKDCGNCNFCQLELGGGGGGVSMLQSGGFSLLGWSMFQGGLGPRRTL